MSFESPFVALVGTKDCIKAALFDLVAARQAFNHHLPAGMRIFQVHVERGRISSAGPAESSFAASEFHAALEVFCIDIALGEARLHPGSWGEGYMWIFDSC
jgi:hypothetical protein